MQNPIFYLYQLHPSRITRYLGGFNYYMRPGSGGCMRGEIMTPAEEYEFTHRALDAINTRPADWAFNGYRAKDNKTDITFWIASGEQFLRLDRSDGAGIRLRRGSQKRIWKALHAIQHRTGTDFGKRYIDALRSAARDKAVAQLAAQTASVPARVQYDTAPAAE